MLPPQWGRWQVCVVIRISQSCTAWSSVPKTDQCRTVAAIHALGETVLSPDVHIDVHLVTPPAMRAIFASIPLLHCGSSSLLECHQRLPPDVATTITLSRSSRRQAACSSLQLAQRLTLQSRHLAMTGAGSLLKWMCVVTINLSTPFGCGRPTRVRSIAGAEFDAPVSSNFCAALVAAFRIPGAQFAVGVGQTSEQCVGVAPRPAGDAG